VTEDGHGHARVDVEGDEKAGAGPPSRVDGDDRHAGLRCPQFEVAVEIAWVDWIAELGRGGYQMVCVRGSPT